MKPMGMSGRTVWSLVLLGSVLVILAGPAWGQIPTESDVYVDRGILAYGQGQYQDALQAFQEAVRMNPDNVNALYYVGMVYLAIDQPAAAQEALEQAQKLNPNDADVAFQLAPRINAAGRLGQPQLAVELLVTDRPERAQELAQYIDGLNATRQTIERSIQLAAAQQAKEQFDPALRTGQGGLRQSSPEH